MKSVLAAAAVLSALLAPGCFTTTHLKTAEVNPPAGVSVTVGGVAGEGGGALAGEMRVGLIERVDVGVREDFISTCIDLRVQLLKAETGGPLDCSIELGAGLGGWTAFRYGGIYLSKEFEGVTPIIGYRYIDGPRPDSDDVDDANDEDNGFAEELIDLLLDETYPVHEVFVGVEIDLSPRFSVIPEILYIPNFDDYVQLNVGLRFELW